MAVLRKMIPPAPPFLSASHRPVLLWGSGSCCSWSCSCSSCCSGRWWKGWTATSWCVWVRLRRTRRWRSRLSGESPAWGAGLRSWLRWMGGRVCEVCVCDAYSVGEGSDCVHAAWLHCAVGCWAAPDRADCGGRAWIWRLVELGEEQKHKLLLSAAFPTLTQIINVVII